MTFDDQLKRAFDTLSDRVRDELDRQVRVVMDELSMSARREADAAAAAAVAAMPPPPTPEPVIERVVERVPQEDTAAAERLLDGIRAIDAARTLTEVLDALIAAAAHDDIGAGIWLLRSGRLRYWRSTGIAMPPGDITLDDEHPHHRAIADAARTHAASMQDGVAVPLAISGQVVAVVWIVQGSDSSCQLPASSSLAAEVLARHAARCLESLTAFKTARAMADRAAPDAQQPPPPGEQAAPHAAADAANAEEHVAAQRYARLLVSEIKLYHEQAVVEGRRDRDLATRLGGEIARARVMYEQRVPQHIRRHADHFHDELVRTLADGDPSLLELKT